MILHASSLLLRPSKYEAIIFRMKDLRGVFVISEFVRPDNLNETLLCGEIA